MATTLSYDLKGASPNQTNYIRSMFERFGWRRGGGSVLRYEDDTFEDWFNNIAPAIMFMRAFLLNNHISLTRFTIDSNGTAWLDHSEPNASCGTLPLPGTELIMTQPTNSQSSEQTLRDFVDAVTRAAPAVG